MIAVDAYLISKLPGTSLQELVGRNQWGKTVPGYTQMLCMKDKPRMAR